MLCITPFCLASTKARGSSNIQAHLFPTGTGIRALTVLGWVYSGIFRDGLVLEYSDSNLLAFRGGAVIGFDLSGYHHRSRGLGYPLPRRYANLGSRMALSALATKHSVSGGYRRPYKLPIAVKLS